MNNYPVDIFITQPNLPSTYAYYPRTRTKTKHYALPILFFYYLSRSHYTWWQWKLSNICLFSWPDLGNSFYTTYLGIRVLSYQRLWKLVGTLVGLLLARNNVLQLGQFHKFTKSLNKLFLHYYKSDFGRKRINRIAWRESINGCMRWPQRSSRRYLANPQEQRHDPIRSGSNVMWNDDVILD